jgi:hypothetical protein
VEDLRRHRIEEGLGELGLQVVGQQADVVQLDLLPHVHRQRRGVEFALEPLCAFTDSLVVELDAFALRALLPLPVGALEAGLRLGAHRLEEPVVLVESFEHRLRDVERAGVGELLREQRAGRHQRASAAPA